MFSADLGGAPPAATPAATDPPFNRVALLLHGDGTNGAQNNTFVDSSSNNFTVTRTGNVAQGTFSPFSLAEGQWSNYFDGSGDNLTVPYSTTTFDWWDSDYTIEAWIYPTSFTGWAFNSGAASIPTLIGNMQAIGNINYWSFGINASGNVLFFYYTGVEQRVTSSNTVSLNVWNHIALTKTSSGITLFVNGVAQTTTAIIGTPQSSAATTLSIGAYRSTYINGYVSNVRIVKGTALYTSNFTPSTTPLTAISGTSLLTCQSNRFKDNSSNNFTITRVGDTRVTAWSPFVPSAAYSASTNGGSGYFDGSGDYLQTSSSSSFNFGTGDFTAECWFYPTAIGRQHSLIDLRSAATNGWIFYVDTSNRIVYYDGSSSANSGSSIINLNAWQHIAFTRSGTSLKGFLNGVQVISVTNSRNNATDVPATIGASFDNPGNSLGYISEVRINKGTALYTATFTPPTAPLTAVSGTQLLLNFTNAGIIDNAGKNDIETVGNAQISTSVKKYGTGSMYFDGNGDYISGPSNPIYAIGTGQYTFEGWFYFNQLKTGEIFMTSVDSTSGRFVIYVTSTTLVAAASGGAGATSGSISWQTGQWYHVAASRDSLNNQRVFVNGVLLATSTSTNNYTQNGFSVGRNTGNNVFMNGYADDVRLTIGQCLYTSNFTPPTQAFPDN